jgi:hypothetical protein
MKNRKKNQTEQETSKKVRTTSIEMIRRKETFEQQQSSRYVFTWTGEYVLKTNKSIADRYEIRDIKDSA